MNLKQVIEKKFPKTGAERFTVWDELGNKRFTSEDYERGDYLKNLLRCKVIEATESCGPFGSNSVLTITVETGDKRKLELLKAARTIQENCAYSRCSDCVFHNLAGFCTLGDQAPLSWSLPDP